MAQNLVNAILGNEGRKESLIEQGLLPRSNIALERLSLLCTGLAAQMGVNWIEFEGYEHDVLSDHAFDDGAPLFWAVALHSQILLRLAGLDGESPLFVAQYPPSYGEFAFGVRPFYAPDSGTPASLAVCAMSAAVEHAVTMGIASVGLTSEQWQHIPEEERIIPFDPYIEDLEYNWSSLVLYQGQNAEIVPVEQQIERWPRTLTRFDIHADLTAYQRIMAQVAQGQAQAQSKLQRSASAPAASADPSMQ